MIASFPHFQDFDLTLYGHVEKLINRYDPYSDFNFASLWAYNTGGDLKISILNKNLVIILPDYITSRPAVSILGDYQIEESLDQLLAYAAQNEHLSKKLGLVPEVVVESIGNKHKFEVIEDEDNHDYILSVDEVADFTGKKYYDKRNLVNRFNKAHPDHIIADLDLADELVHQQINHIFDVWAENSSQSHEESANEKIAINRLLEAAEQLKPHGLGCYVEGELVGFTTYEKSFHKYGFISFEKADRKYPGLYAVLNQQTAKRLKELDCEFINFEQDMGIPGLKQAKQLWRPVKFLKKYSIGYKS